MLGYAEIINNFLNVKDVKLPEAFLLSPGQLSLDIVQLCTVPRTTEAMERIIVESYKSKYKFLPLLLIFHWLRQITEMSRPRFREWNWSLEAQKEKEIKNWTCGSNIYISNRILTVRSPTAEKHSISIKSTKS